MTIFVMHTRVFSVFSFIGLVRFSRKKNFCILWINGVLSKWKCIRQIWRCRDTIEKNDIYDSRSVLFTQLVIKI